MKATSTPRSLAAFLQPYLHPPEGKKPKPLPDWLFVVPDDDRRKLDEITVFGCRSRASQSDSGDRGPYEQQGADDESGTSRSGSPGVIDDAHRDIDGMRAALTPRTLQDQRFTHVNEEESPTVRDAKVAPGPDLTARPDMEKDGEEEDFMDDWEPSQDVRQRGPAHQADSPPQNDDDVYHDESIDYPVPPRPPTASPRELSHTIEQESLHLYPRPDIHRDPTPAVLRGYANSKKRPHDAAPDVADTHDMQGMDDGQDLHLEVTASQRSHRTASPVDPASSGQSMQIRAPRKSRSAASKRTSESLDLLMAKYNSTPSTHRDTPPRASQQARDAQETLADTADVDEEEMNGVEFDMPTATMPFPPAGQKRSASEMLDLPSREAVEGVQAEDEQLDGDGMAGESRSSGDQGIEGDMTSPWPVRSGGTNEWGEEEGDTEMADPQHPIEGMSDVDGADPPDGPVQREQATSGLAPAIMTDAATRPMPTPAQQLPPRSSTTALRSHTASTHSPQGLGNYRDPSNGITHSTHDPESLESNKTSTSEPSTTHTRPGVHNSTSTGNGTGSGTDGSRVVEGQRPIPSRGHQTNWISHSPMVSMYDVRGLGPGREAGAIKDPTPSLSQSQSQSQEDVMRLGQYTADAEGSIDRKAIAVESVQLDGNGQVQGGGGDAHLDDESKARHSLSDTRPNQAPSGPLSSANKTTSRRHSSERRPSQGGRPVAPTHLPDPFSLPTTNAEAGPSRLIPAKRVCLSQDGSEVSGVKQGTLAKRSTEAALVAESDKDPLVPNRPHQLAEVATPPSLQNGGQARKSSASRSYGSRQESIVPVAVKLEQTSPVQLPPPDQGPVTAMAGPERSVDVQIKREPRDSMATTTDGSLPRKRRRPRPPLLNGFKPNLNLPLGVDTDWLQREMKEVEDIRREQGYL